MKLIIGLLAHVDAGKTTLSENLLYNSGTLRQKGRVDHRDTFLDTHELERERGITIFSKQARMTYRDKEIILIDTPGHVDFSAEMERTLQVLDAAVLLISSSDGIGPYTKTLFGLLQRYNIPTFIFVNKMDIGNISRDDFAKILHDKLSGECVPFDQGTETVAEEIAVCDEKIMDSFLETGELCEEEIRYLVSNRKVIPCYFGSALKNQGIDAMLEDIVKYASPLEIVEGFAARVYKIDYDEKNQRVTFLRLLGGSLKNRDNITYPDGTEEKVNQLRLYSGSRFIATDTVVAGDICGVMGLEHTKAGMTLGEVEEVFPETLSSVISYRVRAFDGTNSDTLFKALQVLAEEDPALRVNAREDTKEIYICLMGDVQMEIITQIMKERFGIAVGFDLGDVIYQETISEPVIGIGHFEPLRHYGEVHLLLEPASPGSGIHYSSICSVDILALPYQKQILNALEQDEPKGVLIGAGLTDVNVKLIAGRAHEKHTEGGDLRQAARRALRQGLMKLGEKNVLLEPYESFVIKIPTRFTGRLMTELKKLYADFGEPELEEGYSVLSGKGPVSSLTEYKKEVIAYTGGDSSWEGRVCGFYRCHRSDEVIAEKGYIPEADLRHSPDSVFCAHGAGYSVPWQEVDARAHVQMDSYSEKLGKDNKAESKKKTATVSRNISASDEELEEIFERTFGKIKRDRYPYKAPKIISSDKSVEAIKEYKPRDKKGKENILIVDGYNVIYDWDDLNVLARDNIDSARDSLIDRLMNYQGYTKKNILLVFDAYRTPNPNSKEYMAGGVKVVYTAKNETADMYIQKFTVANNGSYQITVATSDGLEQLHIFSQGGIRMSSREFLAEVVRIEQEIRDKI